jgi:poly-gamma-glutamate synthesis protein (capsule biosynthesis protein)
MGKRRRTGKHIKVFIVSLCAVLLFGTAAMYGYLKYLEMKNKNQNTDIYEAEIEVVDFSSLGQHVKDKIQYDDKNIQEWGEISPDTEDTSAVNEENSITDEDKRLYEDALDKGEKAILVKCEDGETVTFAFAGDVLLDDEYAIMYRYKLRGSDITDTFSADLLEKMRGADVFMLNNEFPFSTGGEPTEDKQFTFRANPSNVDVYGLLGVDVVSLANNHAYDYGEEALLDTFETLENADISYVGAGRNIDEAKKPVYIIANGMKIAVVSATQIERNSSPDTKEATATNAGVLRCMDETKLLEVIDEAKSNSDFVILYIHWGTESEEETDWLQEKQAHVYAEAGVDLIIGDHPHCLQKLDVVSGVPVAYSLGNYWFNSKTQDTCLVEVGIGKEGLDYFKFVPCRQEDCRTRELSGIEKAQLFNYMRELSPNVQIDDEGYVTFGN